MCFFAGAWLNESVSGADCADGSNKSTENFGAWSGEGSQETGLFYPADEFDAATVSKGNTGGIFQSDIGSWFAEKLIPWNYLPSYLSSAECRCMCLPKIVF